MNILLVVPEFPPNTVGGGGVVFENLAREYFTKGHKVTVMHGNYKAASFFKTISKKTYKGIKYISVPLMPYPKFENFVTSTPASINATLSITNIIRKGNFDVIHAHGIGHIFVDTCVLVSNKPVVFTVHGVPDPANIFARMTYSFYKQIITRLVLKKASLITAVSKYTADMLARLTSKKVVVIENGLNTSALTVENNKDSNSTFTILSAGRIIDMKGFDKVIKLLPQFINEYGKVKYIIAGRDAGGKKNLIKYAKTLGVAKEVEFVGFVNRRNLSKLLNKANIVAITSSKEPFNIFALESMYFNKVILTTFGGGLKTTLKGYNKSIDITSSNLFNQIKMKQRLKSNFNAENFSWVSVSDKYLNLLKKYAKK